VGFWLFVAFECVKHLMKMNDKSQRIKNEVHFSLLKSVKMPMHLFESTTVMSAIVLNDVLDIFFPGEMQERTNDTFVSIEQLFRT